MEPIAGYAEYAQFESFEDENDPDNRFWEGGALEDKDATKLGLNEPITLNPLAFPVGTRIIVYVVIDENAQADWPQF